MMKTLLFAASLLCCQGALAANRCTIDGRTVYQDPPCPGSLGTVGEGLKEKEAQRRAAAQQDADRAKRQSEIEAASAGQLPRSVAIDRMTTYTTVLGRGIACEVPGTDAASRRFGAWMDAQGLAKDYLRVAAEGIKISAVQQREGKSPDSCAQVRATFDNFPWP